MEIPRYDRLKQPMNAKKKYNFSRPAELCLTGE